NLAGENRRARRPDTAQLYKHLALSFDSWVLRVCRVAFGFDRPQLLLHQIETGIFTFEFGTQTIWQRQPFSGAQFRKIDARSFSGRFDAANALPEQKPLDAVDMRRALSNQPLALPMRTARVLLFHGWNANDGADMTIAPVDGDDRPHEHQNIDPIGLDPARPA